LAVEFLDAQSHLAFTTVAESTRTLSRFRNVVEEEFLSKIAALPTGLRHDTDPGAVVLIGANESQPLTILDGNHQLVAAILTFPEARPRLRFFCGPSSRMTECCW
jgi:hypothetical protein